MNVTKGDLRDRYTSLICKSSYLQGYKATEKLASDKRAPVLFQKNVWVDMGTMINLANAFIEYIRDKHNELQVLFYCDNLTAYANNTTKLIFTAGKVFLCYFLSSTTESTQPIDAGYSRSLRYIIENLLDTWLI